MFVLILFIGLLHSGSFRKPRKPRSLQRCPYPLAQDIEPCICEVDEKYRLILTCDVDYNDFTEENFDKVTQAFDYQNEIYSFAIESGCCGDFHPQLNSGNLGKLNITHFSLKKMRLANNLFGEGAFEGSAGSIQSILVQDLYTSYMIDGAGIDLGSHVLHPACSTLLSLKLQQVSQLSSTSFIYSPNLEEVSFKDSKFPTIPSSLFSSERFPKIQSIVMDVKENLTE